MERTLLPPDFVSVEPDMLYRLHDLPVAAKFFYMQVRGLAWGKQCTPWLSMDELEEITGKGHSTIWGYMSTLKAYPCLLWQTSGDGKFMFTFVKNANSEKLEQLRKTGNDSSTSNTINNNKDIDIKEEEQLRKTGATPKSRSVPTNPREAVEHPDIRVFVKASERVPGQTQYKTVIETIRMLREKLNADDEQLANYLKPYRDAWISGKRKDGKPYSPSAIIWLTEWAVNGHIPQAETKAAVSITDNRTSILERMAKNATRN